MKRGTMDVLQSFRRFPSFMQKWNNEEPKQLLLATLPFEADSKVGCMTNTVTTELRPNG